ncbi:hypothetical protein Pcinc_002873 [Petrolisthes cinctipes]|uniref:Uncharacterized protein n=1 Tax=Petrolisthes cinctipes TaxID=88211 RepID=A0AAE1L2J9_PETCI|nr:hypothetical protein Pcinc_002873 [Petrolisthes cinctipes]
MSVLIGVLSWFSVPLITSRPCRRGIQTQESVSPEDSVSQFRRGKVSPGDMSVFFKDFASFLRLPEDSQQISLPAIISEMVAKEVEGRLVASHVSLPATSSPWVQGAVQTATNPLSGLSARHSVKSLLADVSVEGYQGQERSGGDVQASSSLDPSIGKRSRPPKDVPWRIKRSRPGVGGDLATSCPGSP